jgi:IMP dehydrogenase/GMP reductase
MSDSLIREGLTFDDVLLAPGASDVLPGDVDLSCSLTRELSLNTPLVSAAMDTITEHETAICLAQNGGIGMIHKNLSIGDQADEVDKVKRSESGMIVDPITMRPEQQIYQALEVMARYRISGVPVTRDGKAVGILTNRDLRFVRDTHQEISKVMTRENLVTVPPGTTIDRAKELLHEHRIEKLLVVDDRDTLCGLITIKDIEKSERFPFIRRRAGRKGRQGLRLQRQQREGPPAESGEPPVSRRLNNGVKRERKEQRPAGRALIRGAPGLGAVRVAPVTAPMSLEATRGALRCRSREAVEARVLFPAMVVAAQRAPKVRAAEAVWGGALEGGGVKQTVA